MFVDVELGFVVEQAIKNVGRFALARADRQDAEIASARPGNRIRQICAAKPN
jgi:hypothetical protein